MHWRVKHRFCGVCGGPCEPRSAGNAAACANCGAQHFPRTDPAVIMLVVRGGRALRVAEGARAQELGRRGVLGARAFGGLEGGGAARLGVLERFGAPVLRVAEHFGAVFLRVLEAHQDVHVNV